GAGLRVPDRVQRPALRAVPAGRVRRPRGDQRADRGAVPGRLARPTAPRPGVDTAEDVRAGLRGDLAAGGLPPTARGPAAAARLALAGADRPGPARPHRRSGPAHRLTGSSTPQRPCSASTSAGPPGRMAETAGSLAQL